MDQDDSDSDGYLSEVLKFVMPTPFFPVNLTCHISSVRISNIFGSGKISGCKLFI